jgi:hypothetical protein
MVAVGLGGSLHCLGMCGGLSATLAKSKKDMVLFNIGRLISYLFLFSLGLSLVSFIPASLKENFAFISTVIIGLLFIVLGLKRFNINLKWKLFKNIKRKSIHPSGALLGGMATALLPCGFLYSVLFILVGVEYKLLGILLVVSFWLGTVPVLLFGPSIYFRFIAPIERKVPRIAGASLIILGVVTVGFRLTLLYQKASCH